MTQNYIQTKTASVHLVTWNVGNSPPPEDFTELLTLDRPSLPDVYGIGLQELGSGEYDAEKNCWSIALTKLLGPKGYVLLKARKMLGILLVVFVKRRHLLSYTHVESEITRAGMAGWWGNKGGVSVRFDINGVNMIIVNSHLAAHHDNSKERIVDFCTVLESQKFRDKDVDSILDHDYVFWMGDLNFRIDKYSRHEVEKYITKKEYTTLLKQDQLTQCREEGLIFIDFEESDITFAPTYKFDPGTDTYDTSSKMRIPAWCDRILWLVHEDAFENITLSVKPEQYKSCPTYLISDHKPVTSSFNIEIFPHLPVPVPVTFQITKGSKFYIAKEVDVTYSMREDSELKSTKWDWIGLYKSDFGHLKDYETYVWAEDKAEKCRKGVTITFSNKNMTVHPGTYILCYVHNHKNTLLGMSEEFQVVP